MAVRVQVQHEDDVTVAVQAVLRWCRELRVGEPIRTRVDLVARELAWNLVNHAGGGALDAHGGDAEITLTSTDAGPGIRTMGTAGTGSLGQGLLAVQRQSTEFVLETRSGGGTVIRSVLR